jgi:hypothetical protein
MTFFACIAGANDKMNIVNFSFDPEEKYTWSGITGGFLGISLFWNRSISSGTLFIWEIGSRKPNGTHHERIIKSADAVLYFIDWCYGIFFNSIPFL